MTEAKKSQKSPKDKPKLVSGERKREVQRIILATLPVILSVLLLFFPELGLSIFPLALFFALGALIGAMGHYMWIGTLLEEHEFYEKYYNDYVNSPGNNNVAQIKTHARNHLSLYIYGIIVAVAIISVFIYFGLNQNYLMPLMLGSLEGVPISVYLILGTIHPNRIK